MADLWEDPQFIAFLDDFIDLYGTPPSTVDIMAFLEAKASAEIDREGGTHHV